MERHGEERVVFLGTVPPVLAELLDLDALAALKSLQSLNLLAVLRLRGKVFDQLLRVGSDLRWLHLNQVFELTKVLQLGAQGFKVDFQITRFDLVFQSYHRLKRVNLALPVPLIEVNAACWVTELWALYCLFEALFLSLDGVNHHVEGVELEELTLSVVVGSSVPRDLGSDIVGVVGRGHRLLVLDRRYSELLDLGYLTLILERVSLAQTSLGFFLGLGSS